MYSLQLMELFLASDLAIHLHNDLLNPTDRVPSASARILGSDDPLGVSFWFTILAVLGQNEGAGTLEAVMSAIKGDSIRISRNMTDTAGSWQKKR